MMQELYPLKCKPIFKERIWGGKKLKKIYNFDDAPDEFLGEVWILSGLEEECSIVTNGFLKDNDLNELVEVYMGSLVGEQVFAKYGNQFPLLVKLIDAKEKLSIQVHPNDDMAEQLGELNGKSEMWYILDAEQGAEIICGLKPNVNKEMFSKAIAENTVENLLHIEKSYKGDVFYIPAGRVHGIGGGNLLLEIQQPSDTTYRVYDYDRVDNTGKKRELHINEALQAIDFSNVSKFKNNYAEQKQIREELLKTPYFCVNKLKIANKILLDYFAIDSFIALVCIEGKASVISDNMEVSLNKGEIVIIPAELNQCEVITKNYTELIEIYLDTKHDKK